MTMLCIILACWPAWNTVAVATDPPAADAAATPSIPDLIRELGSPRWRTRAAATNALMDQGPACYDALRAAFAATRSYEVRRRIRMIAEEVFVTQAAGPPPAFLGIQLQKHDPRMPPESHGLLVLGTLEGTAADRAGLKRGDLILSLNGHWLSSDYPPGGRLDQWIRTQRPGTECRLGVLRGGEGILLDHVSARTASDMLNGLALDVISHEDDPRAPAHAAALLVTETPETVRPDGIAPDIRAGDLILALNHKSIPKEGARETFNRWTHTKLALHGANGRAKAGRPNAPAAPPPKTSGRSLQILRGGRSLEITAVLGRRPSGTGTASGAEEARRRARDEFPAWWRETFDPTGLVDETGDTGGGPAWRPRR